MARGARGPARLGRRCPFASGRASCGGSPGRCATTPRSSTPSAPRAASPRYEAEGIELFYTLELTRYYTGRAGRRALADDLRHPFVFANKRARVVHHPRGVVGVIGPWNWPLLNNYADCIAPLVSGNAVVLKPSEHTPLTSLRVAELWRERGCPTDVFQVVRGPRRGGRGAAAARRHDLLHGQRRGRAQQRGAGARPSAWSPSCSSWAASRR